MATYAYGYGFTPFLIHDSQKMGANLTWTVVWLTICAMYKKFGYLPEELHLQFDNTTGENKNKEMLAMCAWLVATFKFRRIRVFFLHKGHTHVIIDQIFGVITSHLKFKRILTLSKLMENIDNTMFMNPQYEGTPVKMLYCLFDFVRFAAEELGGINVLQRLASAPSYVDEHGRFDGCHDFVFFQGGLYGCLLQYRLNTEVPFWPSAAVEGHEVLKKRPASIAIVHMQPIKPKAEWNGKGAETQESTTFMLVNVKAKSQEEMEVMMAEWKHVFSRFPPDIESLPAEHKLVFEDIMPSPNAVPRTATRPNGFGGRTGDKYEPWMYKFLDRWEQPTVEVTGSSNKVFKQQLQNYQRLAAGSLEPTARTSEAGIFACRFVVARVPDGEGVIALFRLHSTENNDPFCPVLRCTGELFDHKEQPNFPGLFGTFVPAFTPVPGMPKGRKKMHPLDRSCFIAVNVRTLFSSSLDGHVLDVASLKAVAAGTSVPMPNPLPRSHLYLADTDSEDDNEEGDDQPAPARELPARGSPARKTRKTRNQMQEEEHDEEHEEDREGERAYMSPSSSGSPYHSSQEEGASEDDEEGENEDDEKSDSEKSDLDEKIAAEQTAFVDKLTLPCFAWIDLRDNDEMLEPVKKECPIALAWLPAQERNTDTLSLYWYEQPSKERALVRFPSRKNSNFERSRVVEQAGPSPTKGKKRGQSTKVNRWSSQPIDKSCIVPFNVPSSYHEASTNLENALKSEKGATFEGLIKVSFTRQYMATLIAKCKSLNIRNSL